VSFTTATAPYSITAMLAFVMIRHYHHHHHHLATTSKMMTVMMKAMRMKNNNSNSNSNKNKMRTMMIDDDDDFEECDDLPLHHDDDCLCDNETVLLFLPRPEGGHEIDHTREWGNNNCCHGNGKRWQDKPITPWTKPISIMVRILVHRSKK
jgi:hypothetical protein